MTQYTYFLPDKTIQQYEQYQRAERFPVDTYFYWERNKQWGKIGLYQQSGHSWREVDFEDVPKEFRVQMLLL